MIQLYDNSRISAFRACPRKFFYRHRLHFTHEKGSLKPVFGQAWHAAMDQLWKGGTEADCVTTWELRMLAEGFSQTEWLSQDPLYNLGTFRAMLEDYRKVRLPFIQEVEVLAVEEPFIVPLYHEKEGSPIYYCGRKDKVVREPSGNVRFLDHKTTGWYSVAFKFQPAFTEGFSPNSQMDGYCYSDFLLRGESSKGGYVDAVLVHKKERAAKLLVISRTFGHMDAWAIETRNWIETIQKNDSLLEEDSASAFPKNTDACFNFQRACEYRDLCRYDRDPLHPEIPRGMVIKKWEPFNEEDLLKVGLGETKEVKDAKRNEAK